MVDCMECWRGCVGWEMLWRGEAESCKSLLREDGEGCEDEWRRQRQ